MTTLIQAIATMSQEDLVTMVQHHFGDRLFCLINSEEPVQERIAALQTIRENAVLKALPIDEQRKILGLADDCEDLIKEADNE